MPQLRAFARSRVCEPTVILAHLPAKGKARMMCDNCGAECRKFGKHRNGLHRFQCRECKRTFTEPHEYLEGMYKGMEDASKVLSMLVEGCSVSSVKRLTGIHPKTILKPLVVAGGRCEKVMGRLIVNIPVSDVQCDEIWGFVKKGHKFPFEKDDKSIGDAHCFVAIERGNKLVLNLALGRRDQATTDIFIEGLRAATAANRFQISTDGFGPYVSAITTTLSDRADFGQLIKVYATAREGETKYSPPEVVSATPSDHGRSRHGQDLYVSCGAAESHDADADTATDKTD
jgi:transposase-like protein